MVELKESSSIIWPFGWRIKAKILVHDLVFKAGIRALKQQGYKAAIQIIGVELGGYKLRPDECGGLKG